MTGTPSIHPGMQRWTTILDGGRLQELRRQRGLSQEQLATAAGISLTTMRRLDLPACRPLPVPHPWPPRRRPGRRTRPPHPRHALALKDILTDAQGWLQQRLHDAFDLQLRYDKQGHQVSIDREQHSHPQGGDTRPPISDSARILM